MCFCFCLIMVGGVFVMKVLLLSFVLYFVILFVRCVIFFDRCLCLVVMLIFIFSISLFGLMIVIGVLCVFLLSVVLFVRICIFDRCVSVWMYGVNECRCLVLFVVSSGILVVGDRFILLCRLWYVLMIVFRLVVYCLDVLLSFCRFVIGYVCVISDVLFLVLFCG